MTTRVSTKERTSRDVVYVILLLFAALLSVAALVYSGVLPIAVGDVQTLLVTFNLYLNQPTPATDAVHFGIGFSLGLAGYVAVTHTSPRPVRFSRPGGQARSRAVWAFAGIVAVATALILAKEFFFDPTFEGASLISGAIDFGTYAFGILAAVVAGLALE